MYLLVTRPRYDVETHYLFHWASLLVNEATNRNVKFTDLTKEKATKKNVESYLKKGEPSLAIFNGHGNDVCVAGQNGEILIESSNAKLLKDKIVYMRACSAGNILGKEIVDVGAKAFIGYKRLFNFYTRKEQFREPLKDDYAEPFFKSSNQVGLSLIKGKTAKEAHQDSLEVYKNLISKLLTSDAQNSFLAPDLLWNMKNQVCYE